MTLTDAYTAVIDRASTDSDFRARLVSQPEAVLASEGVDLPKDIKLKVVEDTESFVHLVLPPKVRKFQAKAAPFTAGATSLCDSCGPLLNSRNC